MVSKQKLEHAVELNLLQSEQVDALYQFLNQPDYQAEEVTVNRQEPLKFIRSFGDIFITLGIVLLVLAINMLNLIGYWYLLPAVGFILLAEWLVRIRRLVLPGIAILIAILYFTNKAVLIDHRLDSSFTLGILSLTSLLFYLRHRMPFSLLPFACGIVGIIIMQMGMKLLDQPYIFILLGLVVFSIAMAFDIQDTARRTHLSDSAFWLHLLAAPLIVHGTMVTLLIENPVWLQSLDKEVVMLIFFALFFLVALLLDRRAILISTQMYVIYALTQLLQNQLSQTQDVLMYILMGLGLFVIFFGTYWYKTRSLIFGFLSNYQISRYIPDLNVESSFKAG